MGVGDAQNGIGNNPEAVLPLDSLWKELGEQFKKQNEALSRNNNGGDIHITLEMDGQQIAKGVYKQQKQLTKMGQMDWDFL